MLFKRLWMDGRTDGRMTTTTMDGEWSQYLTLSLRLRWANKSLDLPVLSSPLPIWVGVCWPLLLEPDFRSVEERLELGRGRVCLQMEFCTLFLRHRGPMSPLLFLPNDFESGSTIFLLEGPFEDRTVEEAYHCRITLEAPPWEGVCWPLPWEPEPPLRGPLLGPPRSLRFGGLEEEFLQSEDLFGRFGILNPEEEAWLLCAEIQNLISEVLPNRDSEEIGTERSLFFVASINILDLSMAASLLACRSSSVRITAIEEECLRQLTMELFVCLCWGFTAQSTQQGHVEPGQFT